METQDRLSEADARRAVRMVVLDGVCSMAMGTLQGGPFLTAFAFAIGASNYDVGLLAAIGFSSQIVQIPALSLLQLVRRRRLLTVTCAAAARALWVFIVLVPVLFVQAGVTFLLHWLFLSALVAAVPAPAWNSLLRDVIPPEALGRVFARRSLLGGALGLVLTPLGGLFVDWWRQAVPGAPLYAYSLLFLLGTLVGLVGVAAIARIPEPTMAVEPGVGFADLVLTPFRDRNFCVLLVFVASWSFAVNMATPFFVVYMLRWIALPLSAVTLFLVTSQVTNLIFLRVWGRLADRYSSKAVLSASGPLYLLAILAWSFTTMPGRYTLTLPLLVLIHVLGGMSMAGVGLCSGTLTLKLSPPGRAHAYLTVSGLVGATSGAVAPLVAGGLADFFASRSLSLTVTWAEPARAVTFYAWYLKALDFVFLAAVLVGLLSIALLARVQEPGPAPERGIMVELIDEVVLPFRTISTVEGIRRLAFFPLYAVERLRRGD